MTKSEETYAAWLNVLGSDPVPPGPVEKSLRVLRIVADASGATQRLASAYTAALLAMAPETGTHRALELADGLVNAAQFRRVPYTPGLPLLVDGLDCSPEHVRELTEQIGRYRKLCSEGETR